MAPFRAGTGNLAHPGEVVSIDVKRTNCPISQTLVHAKAKAECQIECEAA